MLIIKTIHLLLLVCAVLTVRGVHKTIERRQHINAKLRSSKPHVKDPVKMKALYERYP